MKGQPGMMQYLRIDMGDAAYNAVLVIQFLF